MTESERAVQCDGGIAHCPNCGSATDEEVNAKPWCSNDHCRVFTFLRCF